MVHRVGIFALLIVSQVLGFVERFAWMMVGGALMTAEKPSGAVESLFVFAVVVWLLRGWFDERFLSCENPSCLHAESLAVDAEGQPVRARSVR